MKRKGIGLFLVLVMLLSLCLVTALPVAAADADPNLVGFWTFNGNADDSSGNNLNGTVYGGAAYVSSPGVQALEFDGSNDYVEIPDNDLLDIVDEITIAAWINPTVVSGYHTIVAKRDGNYTNYALRIFDGHIDFYYSGPSATSSVTDWNTWRSSSTITTDCWHKIAVSCDFSAGNPDNETIINIYVDNALVNGDWVKVEMGSDPAASNNYNLRIGSAYSGNTQYFEGSIDELRIWNRALSNEELPSTPIPEMPTIILFGISIFGIVGYIGYRRFRHDHAGIS